MSENNSNKEVESTSFKIKQLKEKNKDKQKTDSLTKENKQRAKEVRRANKKPHGRVSISNTEGNIIDIIGMSKQYTIGNNVYRALEDVNISIKKGEFIVILGPSGSGKTTLLNVISGLDRATEGKVVVKDINLSALSNSKMTYFRRDHVGFVFQSYNLLSELNAKDNAKIGGQLQKDGNRRLDIDELFERVGLEGKQKSLVTQLSGGQMQRVSIVRALAKNPDIIFADEPTGALDSKTSEQVLDLFKEINEKYGTTIVFVTHDEGVAKLADRIIYVKDGKARIE